MIANYSDHAKENPKLLQDFWNQLALGSGPAFASGHIHHPIKRAYDYFRETLPKEILTLNGGLHSSEIIPRTTTVILVAWNYHISNITKINPKNKTYEWTVKRNSHGFPIID